MNTRRQVSIGGVARLRAGGHAPDFTLPAQDGQTVSLAAQLRRGPVILSFLDGRRPGDVETQLVTLSGCAAQIGAQGGALLAISPVARPSTGTPRDLRVLHDAGCVVAGLYGISAAPATFVVDHTATIVLSLIDAAPGSSLTCASVVSALSALRRIGERRP